MRAKALKKLGYMVSLRFGGHMSLLGIILAGLIGTTAMVGIMSLITRLKFANADMVRAVGSVYTKSYEGSLMPGLIIHYFNGILFGLIYSFMLSFAPVLTPGASVIICGLTGFVHGLIVGLFLMVMVAEYHPMPEFRQAGPDVAIAHVIGHIFFGIAVGTVFAVGWDLLGIGETLMTMTPGRVISDVLAFAAIWIPLFGIPLLFAGYVAYTAFTDKIRRNAHAQDLAHPHVSSSKNSDEDRKAS